MRLIIYGETSPPGLAVSKVGPGLGVDIRGVTNPRLKGTSMSDDTNVGNEGSTNTGQEAAGVQSSVHTLTDAELNAKMASHKRGLQKELTEAKNKAKAFDSLQSQVQELLNSGLIDGVEDLEGFREAASSTLSQFKSEKEQLEAERAKMAKELEKATNEAKAHRTRFETAMIERTISDEAAALVVEGAGREGAIEFFQLKLGKLAEVDEAGNVSVKWQVKDEESGRMVNKNISVKEALQAMEATPTKYGRSFRSTVNGGGGGETVDGLGRTADGNIDFANMDFAKYRELKKKNPGLLNQASNKLTL